MGPGLGPMAVPTVRPTSVSTLLTPPPFPFWASWEGPAVGPWELAPSVADAPTEGRFWGWGGSLFLGSLVETSTAVAAVSLHLPSAPVAPVAPSTGHPPGLVAGEIPGPWQASES